MKTLILNGSPRKNGDTAALLAVLKAELTGEVVELSAYRDKIAPCVDCRHCYTHAECAIVDDMQTVYADDYDNLIVASPVYYGTLTGPLLSLVSRLQIHHTAKHMRGVPNVLRSKLGALILTGGGKGNPDGAKKNARAVLRILNAELGDSALNESGDGVFAASLNTDEVAACDDVAALSAVRAIARRMNT